MLSIQTEKSSSGQMFWILEKRVMQEKMYLKLNLQKKQHNFLVWKIVCVWTSDETKGIFMLYKVVN